jgi:hypothetical protein
MAATRPAHPVPRTARRSTARRTPARTTRPASRRAAPRRAPVPVVVRPRPPRVVILLALIVLPACFLLWLPSSSWVAPQPTLIWRGYQTLLLRGRAAQPQFMTALVARLGPGVVSEVTSPVEFWDFTGLSTAAYSDLDGRLDPSDPRRDRFIDGASAYFHSTGAGEEWHIAYVPAVQTSFRLWLRISAAAGLPLQGEWRLVEFDPLGKLLSLAAVLGLAALLALAQEERRRAALAFAFAGAMAWAPFLLSGGLARFALTLILLPTWFPLMRADIPLRWDGAVFSRLKKPLVIYGCAAAAAFMLVLITSGFSGSNLAGFLSPLGLSILMLLLPAVIREGGGRFHRRMIFEPVPIVRPKSDTLRSRPVAFLCAAVSLVIIGFLFFERGPALPTPYIVRPAHDFSWDTVNRMKRTGHAAALPDFLGLVTHAAFQETIAFGRPWRPPAKDERVYVREFILDPMTGATVARQKVVKVFDATWLESIRRRSIPGSLGALFYAQGRPTTAELRGPERAPLRELPAALVVLVTFLAWLRKDLIQGPLIRGNLLRLNSSARRNQAQ